MVGVVAIAMAVAVLMLFLLMAVVVTFLFGWYAALYGQWQKRVARSYSSGYVVIVVVVVAAAGAAVIIELIFNTKIYLKHNFLVYPVPVRRCSCDCFSCRN